MLSKVKKVFSNKSRKCSNSKSNVNCKTSSVVSVTSSLPDFTREFSTLTEECGYVPTVLVNASKIIEAHIEDKFLFQTQGCVGKVDYLIQILGRDRLSVPRNINIHDVVEAVKVYLHRKATPIVPDVIMAKLIENHSAGSTEEDIRIISQYRKMLPDVVPSVHYVLLLMNKVSKHSMVNGMDERKLATIFVLDILKPLSISDNHEDFEKGRLERVQKLPYNIMVVEHLIRNVHIFEFAPYQQIHEPFVSPPDQIVPTPVKDKQLTWRGDEHEINLANRFPDLRLLARADGLSTPPKISSKLSRKICLEEKEVSRETTPKRKSCSQEIRDMAQKLVVRAPSMQTSEWSQEVFDTDVKGEVSSDRNSFKTPDSSPGSLRKKKKRNNSLEKVSRISSGSLRQLSGERLKREASANYSDRAIYNPKRKLKRSVESFNVKKENSGVKRVNSGIRREHSGTKSKMYRTSPSLKSPDTSQQSLNHRASSTSKSDVHHNLGERRRSDVFKRRISKERSPSGIRKGRNDLAKPSVTPPRHRRHNDKHKKSTLGSSSYSGNRASPRKASPKRSNISRSITSRYSKKGRAKEHRNKMFKKDEELEPWDGWVTESEDVSLIVRTTKNPKTFQFLEKYFMALDPDGNIEKIVFDASTASGLHEVQPTPAKKRGRRHKIKNASSPRTKGRYTASTAASKSMSNWASRKAAADRIHANRIDCVVSSPELLSATPEEKCVSNSPNLSTKTDAKRLGSQQQEQTTPVTNQTESRVYSSTQIDTQGGVKVECKNSIAWSCRGDSGVRRTPKKRGTTWNNVVDWLIDTSLVGIAIFCAAYIYNVI